MSSQPPMGLKLGRCLCLSINSLIPHSTMASDPRTECIVDIKIKRLEGVPRRGIIRSPKKRRWYATVNVGVRNLQTQAIMRGVDGKVTWDESFTFSIPAKSKTSINIAIYLSHEYSNDDKVAVANEFDLIETSKSRESTIELHEPRSENKLFGRLFLSVEVRLPKLYHAPSKLAIVNNPLLGQLAEIPTISESWQRFLHVFQQATELARQIAELNGAAKVAIGTISFAVTVIVKQIGRDERVSELHDIMTTLLLFYCDADELRIKNDSFLCTVLKRLLLQASECTYFILQYQKIESLAQRTAVHLTCDTDSIINRFFATFRTLQGQLALGTSFQATINTEYILNKVNEIRDLQRIGHLQFMKDSGWHKNKQCSPGSRDMTLNCIHHWISSFKPGLFLLVGPPGSGKSAILHTVAGALFETDRLGACVFINKRTEGKRTADSLLRTILYYLALSNQHLGSKIATALAQRPLLDSVDATYYGTFLTDATSDLALYGPLVVIVDGLQGLETQGERALVQTVLSRVAETAHNHLRIILSLREHIQTLETSSVFWEIDSVDSTFSETPILLPDLCPGVGIQECSWGSYVGSNKGSTTDLGKVIRHYSMGSPLYLSVISRVIGSVEFQLGRQLLDEILASPSSPTCENNAVHQLLVNSAKINVLQSTMTIFDHDFFDLPSGSVLFVTKKSEDHRDRALQHRASFVGSRIIHHRPNDLLHHLGCFNRRSTSRVVQFDEFYISIHPCLSKLLRPTNSPLLPITDTPLNIYQICLREASAAENRGPVYARFALPASKPLSNDQEIKDRLFPYGVDSDDLDDMSARSPPEGCEWIILHHGLFPLEKKDGYTSMTVTTPVLTEAILERLTCIWVFWDAMAKESTCLRLRDGREKSNFLKWHSFNDVTYHETHAELVCNGKKKGDLISGDQIQVKTTVGVGHLWAMIALVLRY